MVFTGFLLAFTVIEIFLRISNVPIVLPMNCYQRDNTYNHSAIPNSSCKFITREWDVDYNINSLGFRTKEIGTKPSNAYRILLLGDSFTEGWGVSQENTFSELLETKLNNISSGKKIETVNLGIASYSPIIHYLLIKNIGLSLFPDLVILNLDYGDFSDDRDYAQFIQYVENNTPIAVISGTPENLSETFKRLGKINKGSLIINNQNLNKYVIYLATKSFLIRNIIEIKNIQPKALENNYEKSAIRHRSTAINNLKLISSLLKENDISFIITTFPHRHHIGSIKYENLFNSIEDDLSIINNVYILNLYDYFNNKNPNKIFFKYDIHGNEKFHSLMASGIFDFLQLKDIIDN